MEKLLIIEDDPGIQTQLKWALAEDYSVFVASTRTEAAEIFRREMPAVVTLDLGLPPDEDGVSEGFACLEEIRAFAPSTKVIVITGNADTRNSLRAIDLGAWDFYAKPLDLDVLKVLIQRAFRIDGLERENERLKERRIESGCYEGMIGGCPEIQEVFRTIRKVAATDATVLISGESGTGKELVARAIHAGGIRRNGPLVAINCGAIPENLLESELFGYEKGAFTDARTSKSGLIEKASGGTLFLDEIGELPLSLQVKLLRFLQERTIRRLGATESREVDVRIIGATNSDLEAAVKEGAFREDLFFRVSVIHIALPPLRDRGDDLLVLARHFLTLFANQYRKKLSGFAPDALNAIQSYAWPGNVRELENKVQRAVIMSEGVSVTAADMGFASAGPAKPAGARTLKEARALAEKEAVRRALAENDGNISRAARQLDTSRPTLHAIIRKYGLGNPS